MEERRARRAQTWVATVVAALALSGCGAQASETSHTSATEAAEEHRVTRAESADELITGVLAAMRQQGTVHLAVGNQNPPPVLQVDLELEGGAESDMVAFLDLGIGMPTEVRRTAGMVYLDPMGMGFGAMTTDDPLLTEDDGSNAGAMGRVARVDLLRELEGLAEADTRFAALGTDEGADEPAEHYAVTVNTRKWLEFQTSVPRTLGSRFPDELTMHLWLDGAGLPMRWEYDYPNLLRPDEQSTARTDFSDWGEPVEVEVPDELREQPQ